MVHGAPDWGITSGKKTTYQITDLGEFAVRLGSIVNYDRLGDVIFLDDFEASILKWDSFGFGTGASVALSTESAKNGAQALKITTGDAAGNLSWTWKYLPLPVPGKIGAEISFALGSDIQYIELQLQVYTGATQHRAAVRYRPQDDTLQYYSQSQSLETFATEVDLYENDLTYHTLKLVVDLENAEYVRCRLNEATYDLTDVGYYTADSTDTPHFELLILVRNNSAGNHYVYVDDVILTQNEP